MSYELEVPKHNEAYHKYILCDIYGFRDEDFWFLSGIKPENYTSIGVVNETNTHITIKFYRDGYFVLSRALPKIKVQSSRTFFDNTEIYDNVVYEIKDSIRAYYDEKGQYYDVIPLNIDLLESLILQLAIDDVIQRFV